jgi:transcriptional regulator GlxA family with amidase domain
MDFAAPLEVFDQARFNVFTVAKTLEPVMTSSRQKLIPSYDFTNHPHIEIMVIPAGRDFNQESDFDEVRWMQNTSETAQYILTVCCGSIEYAKAGLLGNQTATTHHGYLEFLKKFAPEAKIVVGRKWVDNGKLLTSGGLCSGIDAALHLVSKIKGITEAERIAKWMEYSWAKDGIANY